MPSFAAHVVDAIERGADVRQALDEVPPYQFAIYFAELSVACPDYMQEPVPRRPSNALNVEAGAPLPRCKRQSPDGRGLAWLLSGGSPLAYGTCTPPHCPRCVEEGK